MRGPGYKLTGDVRRTWRCSLCGFERKLLGDVTTLQCRCREGAWMRLVEERTVVPRPVQRPSDVERRPIDFGIETPPAPAPKIEATIIKPAIDPDFQSVPESVESVENTTVSEPDLTVAADEEEWGEGIL